MAPILTTVIRHREDVDLAESLGFRRTSKREIDTNVGKC